MARESRFRARHGHGRDGGLGMAREGGFSSGHWRGCDLSMRRVCVGRGDLCGLRRLGMTRVKAWHRRYRLIVTRSCRRLCMSRRLRCGLVVARHWSRHCLVMAGRLGMPWHLFMTRGLHVARRLIMTRNLSMTGHLIVSRRLAMTRRVAGIHAHVRGHSCGACRSSRHIACNGGATLRSIFATGQQKRAQYHQPSKRRSPTHTKE